MAEQTYFRWKRYLGGLGVSELRELRQLRDEDSSLKRLVADLSLDKRIFQEVLAKKSEAVAQAPDRQLAEGELRRRQYPSVPADDVGRIELLVSTGGEGLPSGAIAAKGTGLPTGALRPACPAPAGSLHVGKKLVYRLYR